MGVKLSTQTAQPTAAHASRPEPHAVVRSFLHEYTLTDRTLLNNSGVHKAIHSATGLTYAVKRVRRPAGNEVRIRNEATILQQLSHPRIVSFLDFFDEEKECIYLVTELLDGGDLFDRIAHKNHYLESDAQRLIKQLLSAVHYCHSRGIIHHDLRPETIMLTANDDDVTIKLSGFGSAISIAGGNSSVSKRGTPGYVAPEVFKGERPSTAVDVWSIGVITFILLSGSPPIYGNTDTEIIEKTIMGTYTFASPLWDNISADAKDFVSKAMMRVPAQRCVHKLPLRMRVSRSNR